MELVMCVPKVDLLEILSAPICDTSGCMIHDWLIDHSVGIERTEAEANYELVQLVVYVVPQRLPAYLQLFVQAGSEQRLHGCAYLGAAGHVNSKDVKTAIQDFIYVAAQREAAEELIIFDACNHGMARPGLLDLQYCGCIYSQHSEVSSQHILMIYELQGFVLGSREPEITMMIVPREQFEILATTAFKFETSERLIGHLTGLLGTVRSQS
jgi:predicted NUDIX family phosphoesterase